MELSWHAVIALALAVFFVGILIGISGTCLYWTRWRKTTLATIEEYKAKAERLERAWETVQSLKKNLPIERR
jgi:hypothetical protein